MNHDIDIRYAGFWRRLGAALIDGVVFLPNVFFLTALEGFSRPAAFAAPLLGQAIYYSYVFLLTLRYGGTLGKLALGMRVKPADNTSLMWRHVWRRSSVDMLASGIIIVSNSVGLSKVPFATYAAAGWTERSELIIAAVPWMLWVNAFYMMWLASEFVVILMNRRRRALHDFIAGTVVVVLQAPAPEGTNPAVVVTAV